MIPLNDPILDRYAALAGPKVEQVCTQWRIPKEIGRDIAKLALFDIILFIGRCSSQFGFNLLRALDNSGSMAFDGNGERIKDLRVILSRAVHSAMLFDEDGISIRFINDWEGMNPRGFDNIRSEHDLDELMKDVKFRGITPLGRQLRTKVVDDLVVGRARSGQLKKPVLIITITDGQPTEKNNETHDAILYAITELSRMPKYGRGAVSFQFAQVGDDPDATRFLASLDSDPQIGSLVDCTSSEVSPQIRTWIGLSHISLDFENEQKEMMNSNPPVELTPDLWVCMKKPCSTSTY